MSGKRKSASPSAIQVKNRRKTIGTEEKLHVISRLEKGERIGDICHNVRLKKVLSQELKDFCSKTTTVVSNRTIPKNYGCDSLTFLLH
jgi:hypothetical protein